MATTNDDLRALAADNTEAGVSFYQDDGRRIFKDRAEMEAAAFTKPSQQLKASAPISLQTRVAAPEISNLLTNIDAQLKLATETADTMEAARAMASVKGSIAKESARFYQETQGIAHAEFGIPALTAQLQDAIRMDDMAPGYRQRSGMADSDETAHIRAQLQSAKGAADSSINERLAGNQVYQELMAKAKVTESMMAHRVQKDLDQDANLQAKAQEFYFNIPPEEKKLFDEATGNREGDPRRALANMTQIYRDPSLKKQLDAVTSGGERALPALTVQGNVFAKRIAVQRETPVFGSADIAAQKIQAVEAVAMDNKTALEAFLKMKAAGVYQAGEQTQALERKLKLMFGVTAGTSAEDKAAASAQRTQVAVQFAKFSAEKEFNSDILALRHKSTVPVPTWLEAAAANGKVGKIDKNAAIALAHQGQTVQEKQQRSNELIAFYNSAAQTQQKSLLFPVSALATEKIKAEIGLFSMIGQRVDKLQGIEKAFLTGEGFDQAVQQRATSAGKTAKTFLFGE